MRAARAVLALFVAFAAAPALAQGSSFHLDRLPRGKSVTIPRPATTIVPLTSRVRLASTDLPQSVSFKVVNPAGGRLAKVKLSIYDPSSERVQYVDLNPGTPFLYTFRDLGSISVVPEAAPGFDRQLSVQVESNKPLEIAH